VRMHTQWKSDKKAEEVLYQTLLTSITLHSISEPCGLSFFARPLPKNVNTGKYLLFLPKIGLFDLTPNC
jgi:hypothetical protein